MKKVKKLTKKKSKKEKKQREPKYLTSPLNTRVLNYHEYYMTAKERVIYFVIAFAAGAIVAYLFYGGICSDEAGEPTAATYVLNAVIMTVVGIVCGTVFLPIRCRQLKEKRRTMLRRQFMDLLDSLSASIASGNNAVKAFSIARNDLTMQYNSDSMIVKELSLVIMGVENGIGIEDMLEDLGKRSQIKEIESFAQVFRLSYRKGGDFGRIIRDSYEILYNKVQIEMEIETKIASTKNELNMMSLMPILLVGMIKMTGGDFANNFHTATGILATTAGIALVLVAYKIGKVITDIEV